MKTSKNTILFFFFFGLIHHLPWIWVVPQPALDCLHPLSQASVIDQHRCQNPVQATDTNRCPVNLNLWLQEA